MEPGSHKELAARQICAARKSIRTDSNRSFSVPTIDAYGTPSMAPSFDTLSEQDLHEEEEEDIDFSGECKISLCLCAPL
jgi:hypothetical protein